MDSFFDDLGSLAVALALLAAGVVLLWFNWAFTRSRPKGSNEELYHSDGDPRTTDDHLHARDPRNLPPGQALSDRLRTPRTLAWAYKMLPVGIIAGWVILTIIDSFEEAKDVSYSSPLLMSCMAVVFGAGLVLWFLLDDESDQGASRRGQMRMAVRGRYKVAEPIARQPAVPSADQTGEKPRVKRKRKFRRQL